MINLDEDNDVFSDDKETSNSENNMVKTKIPEETKRQARIGHLVKPFLQSFYFQLANFSRICGLLFYYFTLENVIRTAKRCS